MKYTVGLLAAFLPTLAHAHTAMPEQAGTRLSAALSTTWRDNGVQTVDSYWQIPGALMGGEAYPVEQGVMLDDASVTLQHRADSGIHGLVQIGSHDNGKEAEVHHAFAGYTLPLAGTWLNLEGGRMAGAFTPSNGEHASGRRFSESPLALDALLGRQFNDEGLRAQWRWQGWELGLEGWRGSAFPATPGEDGGSVDLYLQQRGNWARLQWQAGLWWLQADARNRSDDRYSSGHSHGNATQVQAPALWFDGQTELSGLFLRLEAPLGSALTAYLGAEWLQSSAEGTLHNASQQTRLVSDANGGWLEATLRWRNHELGLRRELLALDNQLSGVAAASLASSAGLYNDHNPGRTTLLYRWHFSHAFVLRLEWTQDETQPEAEQRVGAGLTWTPTLWSQP